MFIACPVLLVWPILRAGAWGRRPLSRPGSLFRCRKACNFHVVVIAHAFVFPFPRNHVACHIPFHLMSSIADNSSAVGNSDDAKGPASRDSAKYGRAAKAVSKKRPRGPCRPGRTLGSRLAANALSKTSAANNAGVHRLWDAAVSNSAASASGNLQFRIRCFTNPLSKKRGPVAQAPSCLAQRVLQVRRRRRLKQLAIRTGKARKPS